jgi:subtilisin family serine protease
MPIANATPNWNIEAVRSREAMRRVYEEIGDDLDWDGVLIGHLDTGFTNHSVFNLDSNRPALLIDRGLNYMDPGETEPRDPLNYPGGLGIVAGHGTRTAGVLCANEAGKYVGVCPTVPVVPYRVSNGVMLTNGRITNLANAVMDAVDRNQASVISISLGVQSVVGNQTEMHTLGRAVDHAYELGVIICAAAGQTEGPPQLMDFPVYPGRYSRSILVGGINARWRVCFDYEKDRKYIDVWAPADDIWRPNSVSGMPEPFQEVIGGGDGTSYASVHVAGAAAIWLRLRKQELDAGGYVGWQRVEAFRAMLRSTYQTLKGNDVPTKKTPTETGLLDCIGLLDGELPKLADLKKAPLAEPQIN